MAEKFINIRHELGTKTMHLTECRDGFWLYDETRRMNLAMRAKTPQDAFVEALGYYQGRLLSVEDELRSLRTLVEQFVCNLPEELLPDREDD